MVALKKINVVQPDIVLRLDARGVIQEAALAGAMAGEDTEAWVGRPWRETTVDVGADKIESLLEDARLGGVSAFRHINQRLPSGLEVPIEYAAIRLGGKAGLLAIGKSLQAVAELQSRLVAAQQAMERDYWRYREVETRYRLLFRASNEAVILLNAASLRIAEANPAALKALGAAQQPERAVGLDLLGMLADRERAPIEAMLSRVREHGKAPGMLVHLGAERRPWTVRATLMRSEPGVMFLLQLSPAGNGSLAADLPQTLVTETLIERLPDGFVVLDRDGRIKRANAAFLALIEASAEGAVLGEPLGRWLSQPGADIAVLMTMLLRNHAVRLFSTTIRGELGRETEVEISAAGDTDGDPAQIALLVRDVGRRLVPEPDSADLRGGLNGIAGQVGKVSLRKLVQDTVGVVERHYIEAALEMADGNRTLASELLGLSRQSLYAKLGRYGIEGADPADAE